MSPTADENPTQEVMSNVVKTASIYDEDFVCVEQIER